MPINIATLIDSMKSIVLTAKKDGYTPQKAINTLITFCDILEAAGVHSDDLNIATMKVSEWMEATQLKPLDPSVNWTQAQLDPTLN